MGAINTIDQVINHPQVKARGMIGDGEIADLRKAGAIGH